MTFVLPTLNSMLVFKILIFNQDQRLIKILKSDYEYVITFRLRRPADQHRIVERHRPGRTRSNHAMQRENQYHLPAHSNRNTASCRFIWRCARSYNPRPNSTERSFDESDKGTAAA